MDDITVIMYSQPLFYGYISIAVTQPPSN